MNNKLSYIIINYKLQITNYKLQIKIDMDMKKMLSPLGGVVGVLMATQTTEEPKTEKFYNTNDGGVTTFLIMIFILFIVLFILSLVGFYNIAPPGTRILHLVLLLLTGGLWATVFIIYYGVFTDKTLLSPVVKNNNRYNNRYNNRNVMNRMN